MPESRNLFHLFHNILDNSLDMINADIKGENYAKEKYYDICPSAINEKKIDDSLLAINFLKHLCVNNSIIKTKMKDYVRLQYNNSKNHNFIIILSKILECFLDFENVKLIPKYFNLIIAIIEFLTESCSGPCIGNQDCIVKHTQVLFFIEFILYNINYREKNNSNNNENEIEDNKSSNSSQRNEVSNPLLINELPTENNKNEEILEEEKNINNLIPEENYVIKPNNRRIFSYLKYLLVGKKEIKFMIQFIK